jgi:nucleoside 2-deoxyribosyltransferase
MTGRPRIYIAGKFSAQARLRAERDKIQAARLATVSSSWLADVNETPEAAVYCAREHVDRDLREIRQATMVIVDTQDESVTGGREVEIGYALALGREVWRVGPQRNVFHQLLPAFDSWEAARLALLTLTTSDLEVGL